MTTAREIKTTLALDGEKQFKASMDDAYRSMKLLGSEMKINTAEFKQSGSSMESLTDKQKTLGAMQDQQKKIIEALTKAVEESAKAYGESDKKTDDYRLKLNNAKASLVGIEGQLDQTTKQINGFGKETVEAEKKTIDWKATLEKLDGQLDKGIKTVGVALGAIVAFGTAVVASGKKVWDATVDMGKFADGLLTTSEQTGISTTSLQEWGYAAQFIDTELDTITKSMSKMVKGLLEAQGGTGKNSEAFKKLGVSIVGVNGELLNSEDIFFSAVDALGKVENATERDAIAMQLFGKSAQELNPLINAGSVAFKELGKEASDMGLVLTEETVDAFGAFDDSMNVMNATVQSAKNSFITALLPAMETIGGVVQMLADKFNEWLKSDGAQALLASLTDKISNLAENLGNNLGPIIDGVINAFEAGINVIGWVIDNVDLLKGVFVGLSIAMGVLKTSQILLNLAMAASPIGWVTAGVGLLVAAIAGLTIGLGGSKKSLDSVVESITPFDKSVSSLRPTLLDINDLLSSTGKSVRDIDKAIGESEAAITSILSTALSENRALRQGELDSIKSFNDQMLALQLEKLQLYRDQQLAELRKLQLEESTLTQASAAQRIANAEAAYTQSNAITEQAYTSQLAIIENKYRAMKEVGSDAYNNELKDAQDHYNATLAENKTYVAKSYAVAANAAASWVSVDRQKWDDLNDYSNYGSKKYARALSQMDLDTAQAFMSMVATTKKQGGVLSADTLATAASILAAFDNLPPYLEKSGKNALLGVIQGMEDQIPALKSSSTMTSDAIVNTIKNDLDIHSPSRVMNEVGKNISKGIAAGVKDDKFWLQTQLSTWAGDVISWIKGVFGIHSPSTIMRDSIGKQLVAGMAQGITNNTGLIDRAMNGLIPSAINSDVAMSVTRRFNDVAGSSAIGRGSASSEIIAGFKAALADNQQVIILNDREFGRAVRKVGIA